MIVVTAPTSKIGGRVLQRLLGTHEPVRVIARDPARLPETIRERVEVFQGSHADADVVGEAFAGADAAFWLVPADPRSPSAHHAYVEFARPGVEAFAKHGVGHVVGVSALGRGTSVAHRAGHVTGTLAMDDLIAASGVAYRALANPSFMDNTLRSLPEMKNQGTLTMPIAADRKLPYIATRDIGDAAAGLLLERDWTGCEEVALLGPEDLSGEDMVRTLTEVLGTPVDYVRSTADGVRAAMLAHGTSEGMAQAMVDMMLAKDAGLDQGVPRTARNSTPTTFRQWCAEVLKPAFEAA